MDNESIFNVFINGSILTAVLVMGIPLLFMTFYIIRQSEVGILERFGKFKKIAKAGLHFKIPFVDRVIKQSLKIKELNVNVDTKTKDNVFTGVKISVQYRVEDNYNSIYKSVYELDSVEEQISSYIFDIVRAKVPKLTIDEIFNEKKRIAETIKNEVGKSIEDFGYKIINTLITDIIIDERIVKAMNDIVASESIRKAAIAKAEADKILVVKEAEADAESKKLQGMGIAQQREEIIKGFAKSIEQMKGMNIPEEEILNFILLTQYFDTLKDVAQAPSNSILLPGSPGGFSAYTEELRNAIMTGNIVKENIKEEN